MKSHRTIIVLAVLLGLMAGCDSGTSTAPGNPTTQAAAGTKKLILELTDKVSCTLAYVPPGHFLMGSPPSEKWHEPYELQHEVTIGKPFFMGTTDITVEQFAVFVNDTGYKTSAEKYDHPSKSWKSPGIVQTGIHPVVMVSWDDAQEFCVWLSKRSGKIVQLPTEAQWEYACRAGTETAFPWGENPDDGKGWANCADRSYAKVNPDSPNKKFFFNWDDGYAETSPVASFKPNAFGLYDMIGNVGQWCRDYFVYYDKAAQTDPTGPATGVARTIRGGRRDSGPETNRSASRDPYDSTAAFPWFGFRVVVAGGE